MNIKLRRNLETYICIYMQSNTYGQRGNKRKNKARKTSIRWCTLLVSWTMYWFNLTCSLFLLICIQFFLVETPKEGIASKYKTKFCPIFGFSDCPNLIYSHLAHNPDLNLPTPQISNFGAIFPLLLKKNLIYSHLKCIIYVGIDSVQAYIQLQTQELVYI